MTTRVLDRIMDGARTPEGKVIAVLLALCLSLMSWNVAALSYAIGADGAVAGEQEAAEQQEALTEEAPAADEAVEAIAPAADEAVEAAAAADEAAEPEATEAATDAEANSAAPADSDANAAKDETPAMPAQRFEDSAHALAVVVDAPEGALPEGAKMVVTDIAAAAVIDAVEGEVDGNVTSVVAVDISFTDKNGAPIEPATDISVRLTPKGTAAQEVTEAVADDAQDVAVVHIADSGATETVAYASDVSGASITFTNDSFSVYAVVTTAQADINARLTVKFMNGETELYSAQVKKSDIDSLDTLVYDPGVGALGEGVVFRGWTSESTYTTDTTALDIDGVRAAVVEKLQSGVTEGEVVTYQAMLFSSFALSYQNENGVTLKTDQALSSGSSASFTVNASYTVSDNKKGFLGWKVKGTEGDTYYRNGSSLEVTSRETVLEPVVGEGNWLVFDENDDTYDSEGTKVSGGASFTAPAFIAAGESAESAEPAESPTRPGYTFAGWYTEANGGSLFDFASKIDDETTVYAHWTANENTTYKVIIWKQKVTDDKNAADADKTYDYSGEMYELTGKTDSEITADMLKSYTEKKYEYKTHATNTMFTYNRYEIVNGNGEPTSVNGAKGDTVVNVYFDRALFTIEFYPTRTDRANNKNLRQTMTGLYGQPLSMYGYTWPSAAAKKRWYSVAFLDAFTGNLFGTQSLSSGGGTPNKIQTYESALTNDTTIVFYLQDLSSDNRYSEVGRTTYDVAQGITFNMTDRVTGSEPSGYAWSGNASTPSKWSAASSNTSRTSERPKSNNSYLHIKYDRVKNSLVFMNGSMEVKEISGIPYEQSLASYESQAPTVSADDGYYFAGWYEDAALTQPFDWNSQMPPASKIIYAKVAPQRYHVVVNTNGGELANGQSDNFRVDYGDTIESANFDAATKGGYSLVGWYTDEACTQPFNFKTHITDDVADMTYKDNAELREQYGDNTKARSDVVGLVTLYALWSDDSLAESGIQVQYVDDNGTVVSTDANKYADAASIVVASAPSASSEDKVFAGWKLGDAVYNPGQLIEIHKTDAAEKDGSYVVTLTATYKEKGTAAKTTVRFDANEGAFADGKTTMESEIDVNGTLSLPTDPTRVGYKFIGWAFASDAKEADLSSDENYAADGLTGDAWDAEAEANILYAVWERNVFTVTFVDEDGKTVLKEAAEYAYGTKADDIAKPADPTKDADANYTYAFAGWTPAIADVTEDATYKATYTASPRVYNITYDLAGGSLAEGITNPSTYTPASENITLNNPTRRGYDFAGWTGTGLDAATTSVVIAKGSTGDRSYAATWTPRSDTAYTVEHYWQNLNDEGYTLHDTENLTGTTDATAQATAKTYPGFTFDEENASNVLSAAIASDGSTVLKLYYSRDSFKVTYQHKEGTPDGASKLPAESTYKYGATVSVEPDAELAGYTFNGWAVATGNASIAEGSRTFSMPAADVVLEGSFTANTDTAYTVKHYQQNVNDDGYTLVEADTENLTGTTDATASANWKDYEGFTHNTTKSVASSKITGDGKLVLELYYDRATAEVTYSYAAGSPEGAPDAPEAKTYRYGASVTIASAPTLTGYTFDGWKIGGEPAESFTMGTSNVEVTGSWTAVVYNITYDLDGGENAASNPSTYTTEDEVTLAAPTKTGYTFKQWVDGGNDVATGIAKGSTGDKTFKAQWTINQYKVTYSYTGNVPESAPSAPAEATYDYQANVKVADKPTLAGYTFSGWKSGDDVVSSFAMPAEDVALTGSWSANTDTAYKVEHYTQNLDGDGYTLAETENLTGTTDTQVTATAKAYPGFTFDSSVAGTVQSGTVAGNGGLILKLYYTRNSHTVTYSYTNTVPSGAPAVPAQVTYKYGATVNPAAAPELIGYTFSGWMMGTQAAAEFTMPDDDVTITGSWTANSGIEYQVRYYLENLAGTGYDLDESATLEKSGTTGTAATVDESDIKSFTGFTFDRENTNNALSGTIAGDGSTVLALYYSRDAHTVTYGYVGEVPSGTPAVPAQVTYKYGEDVTIEGAPELAGYTFSGWKSGKTLAVDFTMGTEDVEITGSWSLDSYAIAYNLDGGSVAEGANPASYTVLTDAIALVNPEREGYTFTGWSGTDLDGEANMDVTIPTGSTGNREYTAHWRINSYEVSYAYAGTVPAGASPAEAPATESHEFGSSVTKAPVEAPAGYTFKGWTTTSAGVSNSDSSFTMPASNVSFEGSFSANTNTPYKVEYYYMDNDGQYPDAANFTVSREGTTDTTVAATSSDKVPSESVVVDADHYVFDEGNTSNNLEANLNGDGSTVLKVYFAKQFTVTYAPGAHAASGSEAQSSTVPAGSDTPDAPAYTAQAGYTFAGWTPTVAATVTADVAYTAQWTANENTKYTVEYYYMVDGAYPEDATSSVERNDTTDTSASVTEADKTPNDAAKYAYDTAAGNVESGTIAGDGSLVLKVYFKQQMTVKYLPGNHGAFEAQETSGLDYGVDTPAAPETIAEAGYAFAGWSPEVADEVTADVTYIAQWSVDWNYGGGVSAQGFDTVYDGQYHHVAVTTPLATDVVTFSDGMGNSYRDANQVAGADGAAAKHTVDVTVERGGETMTIQGVEANVYPRPIAVDGYSSNDADGLSAVTREYVGVTYGANKYRFRLSGDGLTGLAIASGDSATIGYGLFGTEVGEYDGEFTEGSFKVVRGGEDVTSNYDLVEKNPGHLTIIKSPIGNNGEKVILAVTDATATYDGKSHAGTAEARDRNLHTVLVEYQKADNTWTTEPVALTDAGEATVNVRASVPDSYEGYVYAQLKVTVNKRPITLKSASLDKEYDGTALTNGDAAVTVGGDGWVEGEGVKEYDFGTSSQTVPGYSPNAFTYTLNDNTKAENYIISPEYGTLTVNALDADSKLQATVTAASSTDNVYDGTEKSVSGFTVDAVTITPAAEGTESVQAIPVTASNGMQYYVAGLSAGDSSTDAVPEARDVNVTGDWDVYDADGNNVSTQFNVTAIPGSFKVAKRQATLASADDSKEYDGIALTNGTVTVGGDGFAAGEGAGYTFTGSQTLVGSSANSFGYTLSEGTKSSNYDITKSEGTLTVTDRAVPYEASVTANSSSTVYNGREQYASGFEGEENGRVHVTAGGVDYYVSGLASNASGVDVADSVESILLSGTAHVYDANTNDVTSQFRVTANPGKLEITPASVTLKSADLSKEYDGTALVNGDTALETETGWAAGEGADYTFTGSQTLVGYSPNSFGYALRGNTKAGNYDITKREGQLSVSNRDAAYVVTVTANSLDGVYNGQAQSVSGFEGETERGIPVVANGVTFYVSDLTSEASGTNVADSVESVVISGAPAVADAEGNDVTDQFDVRATNGHLTIAKRPVTLAAQSGEKAYDGTALELAGVEIADEVLASQATARATGSQVQAGSSENPVSVAGIEGAGYDEANYELTLVPGTLTVTAAAIDPDAPLDPADPDGARRFEVSQPAGVVYDGTAQQQPVAVSDAALPEGAQALVPGADYAVSYSDAVDAGTVTVTVTGTGNYSGTLTRTYEIAPRPVTLTSADLSKVYDGVALANGSTSLAVESGWVTGEEPVRYDFTGSQTLVGSSANAFDIVWNQAARESNYSITKTEGTLAVTDEGVDSGLLVSKTHEENAVYDLGDTVTFDIVATNIYDRPMNISFEELPGVTLEQAAFENVAPGDPARTTATYVITAADVAAGSFTNTVTATFTDPATDEQVITPVGSDEVDEIAGQDYALSIAKVRTSTQDAYNVGDAVTYRIDVTNTGNQPQNGVVVTDQLQDAAGSVSFTDLPEGATVNGNEVTLATIAPRETVSLNAEYVTQREDAGATIANTAVASNADAPGSPTDSATAEGDATVEGLYALTFNYVYADGSQAAPSTTATYLAGEDWAETFPAIDGYTPAVNGVAASSLTGTMQAADATYTVVYTAIPAAIAPVTPPAAAPAGPVAPVAAAVPAAAAAAAPPAAAVTIDDDGNPLVESIDDDENALASGLEGEGAWSLFDVLATILTAILAVVMLIGALGKRREDAEENEHGQEQEGNLIKRRRALRIASIVPAVLAVVALLLTQDFTQPMAIFDAWSILFAVIAIVNVVLLVLSRKTTEDDDDEQQSGYAPAAA